jgi:phosphate/sulfate permease
VAVISEMDTKVYEKPN